MSRFFRFALVSSALVAAATAQAGEFLLTSPTLGNAGRLTRAQEFNGFGCNGENRSPALRWQGAPAGTRSFALTVHDPDAPTGSGWWHWVVYNLPSSTTGLSEGAGSAGGAGLPAGSVQGRTDFGTAGFGGACPPQGDKPHRYVFTVHALDVEKLELPADASAAFVGFMLHAHGLGRASFTATYGRP
jgi:Raf kinase inhibitor-like YbhB/YbcL family protein